MCSAFTPPHGRVRTPIGQLSRIGDEESLETACASCDAGVPRGDGGTRTRDFLLAKQVLYQLSYVPLFACGDSEPRPCTRLRRSITSPHLTDRAEIRDAEMSVPLDKV